MKFPITKCPYCGCNLFFNLERYKGTTEVVYHSDGSYEDDCANGGMYDLAVHTQQRTFYCRDCGRKVFILSEEEMKDAR